jgi:hypothetical protein
MMKSRRVTWARHVERTGKKMSAYRILVGKVEGNRTVERPRNIWEDNIMAYPLKTGIDQSEETSVTR